MALRPNASHALPILDVSRSNTTHHIRQDSSGRVISPLQRPLPDNIRRHKKHPWPPAEFEPTVSVGKWLQTYALERAGTWTGSWSISWNQQLDFCIVSYYRCLRRVIPHSQAYGIHSLQSAHVTCQESARSGVRVDQCVSAIGTVHVSYSSGPFCAWHICSQNTGSNAAQSLPRY
jgi:hypothetical protein